MWRVDWTLLHYILSCTCYKYFVYNQAIKYIWRFLFVCLKVFSVVIYNLLKCNYWQFPMRFMYVSTSTKVLIYTQKHLTTEGMVEGGVMFYAFQSVCTSVHKFQTGLYILVYTTVFLFGIHNALGHGVSQIHLVSIWAPPCFICGSTGQIWDVS